MIISPGFKSVAAMAGWDEEALMLATLIVEDTPERNAKKKRSDLNFKSPPSTSRRKRRARRRSPVPMSITVLNLDDEDDDDSTTIIIDKGIEKKKAECSKSSDLHLQEKVGTNRGKAEQQGKERKKAECSKSVLQEKVEANQGKAEQGKEKKTAECSKSDLHWQEKVEAINGKAQQGKEKKTAECSKSYLQETVETNKGKAQPGKEKKTAECSKTDLHLQQKVETVNGKPEQDNCAAASSSSTTLPCVDRLREELSCAICLDICFEPSTTPCGHSFCKKCLKSAADKCGKRCPKCRQLISNGRSCTINTVLWNTIQLLFPTEVEARKATETLNSRETSTSTVTQNPETTRQYVSSSSRVTRRLRPIGSSSSSSRRDETVLSSRRDYDAAARNIGRRGVAAAAAQDEDAALALRLQREEFMNIYRGSSSAARDNLRAMAQRAINLRVRHRAV